MEKIKAKFYIILSIILIQCFQIKSIYSQNKIPDNFCITQQEFNLCDMINKYRTKNNLPVIPISKSLSYVAKLHVKDLENNKRDMNNCNLHSWSDKGNWKACCYNKEQINKSCMLDKPKEITNYSGNGYEITYWESVGVTPKNAFDLWKNIKAANDILLNSGKWRKKYWNALGVGIYKDYAVAWFGEEKDNEAKLYIYGSNTPIVNKFNTKRKYENKPVIKKTKRYYLIFSSYNNFKDAENAVRKFKKRGFKNSRIVKKGNRFRLSLSDYPTLKKAKKAKDKLGVKYKNVWIFPY